MEYIGVDVYMMCTYLSMYIIRHSLSRTRRMWIMPRIVSDKKPGYQVLDSWGYTIQIYIYTYYIYIIIYNIHYNYIYISGCQTARVSLPFLAHHKQTRGAHRPTCSKACCAATAFSRAFRLRSSKCSTWRASERGSARRGSTSSDYRDFDLW